MKHKYNTAFIIAISAALYISFMDDNWFNYLDVEIAMDADLGEGNDYEVVDFSAIYLDVIDHDNFKKRVSTLRHLDKNNGTNLIPDYLISNIHSYALVDAIFVYNDSVLQAREQWEEFKHIRNNSIANQVGEHNKELARLYTLLSKIDHITNHSSQALTRREKEYRMQKAENYETRLALSKYLGVTVDRIESINLADCGFDVETIHECEMDPELSGLVVTANAEGVELLDKFVLSEMLLGEKLESLKQARSMHIRKVKLAKDLIGEKSDISKRISEIEVLIGSALSTVTRNGREVSRGGFIAAKTAEAMKKVKALVHDERHKHIEYLSRQYGFEHFDMTDKDSFHLPIRSERYIILHLDLLYKGELRHSYMILDTTDVDGYVKVEITDFQFSCFVDYRNPSKGVIEHQ
ncbi:hypothetical protein [Vibrio barjaei]|uniref:hypothetical protein n=1 Tax=Vibrio barjaei TaxID=1676683 RepID=UPI002284AE64|nr:hypothetical protein [Vibrio barjaei]MCY9873813.1 hypothetical protein [Vibrio barjaei]